ncbi:hypothetical protein BHE18_15935 [Rossellomorea aquimaris]|uniref:Uncharacterized protein n=1 Tax=Rossellomorea aquimaris TaxID=189382 RepID=A0A1J6VK90_9BACI|nr:hypothetical protein BHE18_15935 [Rossellomorea aquimaris]
MVSLEPGDGPEPWMALKWPRPPIHVTIFSYPGLFYQKINLFSLKNGFFSVQQQVSSQNPPLPALTQAKTGLPGALR